VPSGGAERVRPRSPCCFAPRPGHRPPVHRRRA
jgi:hypothetical protein